MRVPSLEESSVVSPAWHCCWVQDISDTDAINRKVLTFQISARLRQMEPRELLCQSYLRTHRCMSWMIPGS
jgi:hypothetical protein